MVSFDDIVMNIKNNKGSGRDSVILMLDSISAQLSAAGTDPAQLAALNGNLRSHSGNLADACCAGSSGNSASNLRGNTAPITNAAFVANNQTYVANDGSSAVHGNTVWANSSHSFEANSTNQGQFAANTSSNAYSANNSSHNDPYAAANTGV